jgi:hypothetical protein
MFPRLSAPYPQVLPKVWHNSNRNPSADCPLDGITRAIGKKLLKVAARAKPQAASGANAVLRQFAPCRQGCEWTVPLKSPKFADISSL